MPLKHLVEAETHRLRLPPAPGLHPSLPGTEEKQREPKIVSLPMVRQEGTSPTTASSHAIATESRPLPCHSPPGARSPPPSKGGEAGRGPPGCAPWRHFREGGTKAGISSRARGFSQPPPKPPTVALPSQTQGLSWVYPTRSGVNRYFRGH